MPDVSNQYPSEVSTDELYKTIKELSKEIIDSGGNINVVLRFSPLIQLGQNEIQKRLLEKASDNSKKSEQLALAIAVISLLLSGVAVWFSWDSSRTDQTWKDQEIKILEEIRDRRDDALLQSKGSK